MTRAPGVDCGDAPEHAQDDPTMTYAPIAVAKSLAVQIPRVDVTTTKTRPKQ